MESQIFSEHLDGCIGIYKLCFSVAVGTVWILLDPAFNAGEAENLVLAAAALDWLLASCNSAIANSTG